MHLVKFYTKLSIYGKLVCFLALFMFVVVIMKRFDIVRYEGFETTHKFLFVKDAQVYDNFYSSIYDLLVFNNLKNEYEIGEIINTTSPSSTSLILDIGCGTGHHTASLNDQAIPTIGVDISPSMISQAKTEYPQYDFRVGDVNNSMMFSTQHFTHILCMYFTIYYFQNKSQFFDNCYNWLMPGGYLIVHLVNRDKFDPILPPGNPLFIVSPQKYANKRITHTSVKFNDFDYNSDFVYKPEQNKAIFQEKFKFHDGRVRKQEQTLYMEPLEDIVTIAQNSGFIVQSKIDLMSCAYEYQYLYIFTKPS